MPWRASCTNRGGLPYAAQPQRIRSRQRLAVELAEVEPEQKTREEYYNDAVKILLEEASAAIILRENEQKVFAKNVKGFQPIPVNAIDLHRVWLGQA
jgi:hypothetical protein